MFLRSTSLPRDPALWRWAAVYGGLIALWLAAWLAIRAMDPTLDLPEGFRALGAEALRDLCLAAADEAGILGLWVMWALMGAAMMLPTAVPALRDYQTVSTLAAAAGEEPRPQVALVALTAGYLTIWAGFAAVAAVAQSALASAGLVDAFGRSASGLLTAALLLLAGAWQFTPLKEACLARCQSPLYGFIASWKPGPLPAFRTGLRLGADCLACCWALMGLAFVGGTMSMLWMAAAMVFMTLEKLPEFGRPITRPAGAALIAAGLFVGLRHLLT